MVAIPLELRLRRRAHKEIAAAQDLAVREVYRVFNDAVFHGGTAIWRCYGSNRFSEDLDFYLPRDPGRLDALFGSLVSAGFSVTKRKVTDNSLYSGLELGGISVRLEALFRKASGSLADYETADGNIITVYSLTPEELIAEKTSAYLGRRKIKDLYDVFFLLRYVKERAAVLHALKKLVKEFEGPLDEPDLKALIVEGPVPPSAKMLEYISRWVG